MRPIERSPCQREWSNLPHPSFLPHPPYLPHAQLFFYGAGALRLRSPVIVASFGETRRSFGEGGHPRSLMPRVAAGAPLSRFDVEDVER